MRQLATLVFVSALAGSAAGADVHELLEQLKDPNPEIHNQACKQLIAMGKTAAGVLNANLNDDAANAHHRLSYIVDRAEKTYAPGDPWDRSRNVLEGTDLAVWLDGSTKHVQVTEGQRRVHIVEGQSNIRIEVEGAECGGTTRETYTARGPYELLNQHRGAWDIYMRWGGGVRTRWSVEGRTLGGKRFEDAGPIIRRTVIRRFDVLRDWVRGQMAASPLPVKKRDAVEKLLRAGVEALARPGTDPDKIHAYVRVSDELRRALDDAGLADPGELLPPSKRVRLGVTTSADSDGTRVDSVVADSRGERMGLQVGDIVLTVQGRSLARSGLATVIREVGEDELVLEVRRDGKKVRLAERRGKKKRKKKGRRR